jgi:peptidoglycan/xylan/chitin deacetylase (PgdA/CDA1 family)
MQLHSTKSLSNAWLTVFVLFVILLFLSVVYRSLSDNPNAEWQKARLTNLPALLSGTTNFQPQNAPDLSGKYINLPILMYHHIGDVPAESENDALRLGLTVSLKNFEEQVAWLKSSGFNSITLQNLLDYTTGKFTMPNNPVILTFDDGYEDAILNAPPILKKYDFVGSFAVITQFSGIKYGSNIYATWQQIKQAKNAGMEIVSHTQDHFDGTNIKYEDGFVLRNLKSSRQDIKDNLGVDTPVLVYPFGNYDERLIGFAKEAGYQMGVAINDSKRVHLDKLFEIPRLRVNGGATISGFKKMVLE